MRKFEDIEAVAQALGDGAPFNPDIRFETIGEVVEALIDLGNSEKVFPFHDDHLGLKSNLSDDFLCAHLDDVDNPDFESEIY